MPGGAIVNWPLRRRLLSRFANIYIRPVTRLQRARLHERLPLLAARGARVGCRSIAFVSDGYSFLVEMLFRAQQARRCAIAEVPITFVERRQGESKLSRAVLLESAITPWRLSRAHARPHRAEPFRAMV